MVGIKPTLRKIVFNVHFWPKGAPVVPSHGVVAKNGSVIHCHECFRIDASADSHSRRRIAGAVTSICELFVRL